MDSTDLSDVIFRHVGKPIERKEDQRLLTGQGRFTDDFALPGQTYAVMVRSPYPHARIISIDKSAALASPGVLLVLTGRDVLADGLKPIPHNPVPSTQYDMKLTGPNKSPVFIGPHYLLPADRARHAGEAVAMVVAETAAQAADGAELLQVEYEQLPHVTETHLADAPGAPAVWDDVPDNVFVETWFGDPAATDAAFARADHVISATFTIGRVTGVPLELRAALASHDPETGRSTLYAGSGGAVRQKAELAQIFGVPPADIRVLSYDVGGNFGTRNRLFVEFGLVLWASRKLGRPVKFRATRSEAFLSDYQGRDLISKVELAISNEGKFLGLRAENTSNVGARCVSLSPLSKGSGLITGSYDIPAATLRARAVFTNTMCTQAYRSSGRPEVTFVIERLCEMAAERLGIDKLEVRRRNLVPKAAMPYVNAVGSQYDSGEYAENMDRALKLADWDGYEPRRAAAAARGKLLGRGFANYVESSIGTPKERAEIIIGKDGAVKCVIGTQPSGQGHETSFAQVVADMLHLPVACVTMVIGDTDIVSVGGGSHSGRSMRHAGTVIAIAANQLIAEAKRRAARLFDQPAEDIMLDEGLFTIPGTNQAISWFELARDTEAVDGPLQLGHTNEMHTPVFPNGTAICEVEVDPETGMVEITRYSSVDDVGRCINPLIVHGQTHGGIAQGVGQAMWEECVVDPASGQVLSGSFMDYGMPRCDNLPLFRCEIAEVLSPTNPLGIKAGGEGGTTPALATIVNGVVDALKEYGVTELTMPLTPFKIWQAVHKR